MSKKMAVILLGYGIVLAGLGVVVRETDPDFAGIVLISALAGGGLSFLFGLVALAGHKRRVWGILTMIAVAFTMLSQVVHAWLASGDNVSLLGRLVSTLMFAMTVGMIMYLLHGERPPEFYETRSGAVPSPSSGQNRLAP